MGSATFKREDLHPDTTVLTVTGELDVSNTRELRRRIGEVQRAMAYPRQP